MKNFKFKLAGAAQVLLLALFVIPFFSSCKKEKKSDEKEMMNVVVTPSSGAAHNLQLNADGKTWEFMVALEYNQTLLEKAKITFTLSPGATSNVKSGDEINLSSAANVNITVTAEDGSTFTYTIHKEVGTSDKAEFLTFKIKLGDEITDGRVDEPNSKVIFDTPFPYTKKAALEAANVEFTYSLGATVNPAVTQKMNFTLPNITYEITAHNATTKRTWTIVVVIDKSNEANITDFKLQFGTGQDATLVNCTIDDETSVIYYYLPSLDLVAQLPNATPVFITSDEATSSIPSGETYDFSNPVTIEITAEDGTATRTYTVERRLSSAANVDYFFLDFWEVAQEPGRGDLQTAGKIDQETGDITYLLPALPSWFSKSKMNVYPAVIQISNCATVSPDWNVPLDFSKEQTYTVTAEDGTTTKTYTVKVPEYCFNIKWSVDYADLRGDILVGGDQNPNSIALIGDYVLIGRTASLLNKNTGDLSGVNLNVTGIFEAQNGDPAQATQPSDGHYTRKFPFFVTNDDAGNLIGTTLSAWNADKFYVYKWTSPTEAPVTVMELPTKDGGGTQFGSFGRKVQLTGDVNGDGFLISTNSITNAEPASSSLEHYLWKITSGVVDASDPKKVDSGIPWGSNQYQVLTPSYLNTDGPNYYVGSHQVSSGGPYPQLFLKTPAQNWPINGPFEPVLGLASANGWGNFSWFYHKLFDFDGRDMIATFSSSTSPNPFYCFGVLERATDVTIATSAIPWNDTDWPNGNSTGSFTFEKVGDNIFFYIFATNRIVACYQLTKF